MEKSLRDPCNFNEDVKVSLFREGHRGVITSLTAGVESTLLAIGMEVVAGAREDEDRLWVLRMPDGGHVHLDHDMADAATIRLNSMDDA